jgi:hypothetical protein
VCLDVDSRPRVGVRRQGREATPAREQPGLDDEPRPAGGRVPREDRRTARGVSRPIAMLAMTGLSTPIAASGTAATL